MGPGAGSDSGPEKGAQEGPRNLREDLASPGFQGSLTRLLVLLVEFLQHGASGSSTQQGDAQRRVSTASPSGFRTPARHVALSPALWNAPARSVLCACARPRPPLCLGQPGRLRPGCVEKGGTGGLRTLIKWAWLGTGGGALDLKLKALHLSAPVRSWCLQLPWLNLKGVLAWKSQHSTLAP